MKIYWSAFLSLLFLLALAGCGAEQFGTAPTSTAQPANPLQVYQQSSCSGHTLIKPEVDILYVVDNSSSTAWLSTSLKNSIQNTISSISSQFDYRIISTPLLKTTSGNSHYQVLASSALPGTIDSSKVLSSPSQFSFFPAAGSSTDPLNPADPFEEEAGLKRVDEFVSANASVVGQEKLIRRNSYLVIVVVSNGKDYDIERTPANGGFNQAAFNSRRARFANLKNYLGSQQLRLLTVTANNKGLSSCPAGTYSSLQSYGNMSEAVYQDQFGTFAGGADHYDLCSSNISTVFAQVNSTIQQVIIPHSYKYWPITSTDGVIDTAPGRIRVFKSSPSSSPVELTSGWSYVPNPNYPGAIETRVDPNTGNPIAGEPTSRKHLIQFNGSYITYPECISITTSSNLEYFGYLVIPKIPKLESVVIKINGTAVPSSGYTYIGQQNRNIKVAHNGYPATPEVLKSGYMFQLNSSHYYKSGDNVEIFYVPASN